MLPVGFGECEPARSGVRGEGMIYRNRRLEVGPVYLSLATYGAEWEVCIALGTLGMRHAVGLLVSGRPLRLAFCRY